MFGPIKPEDWLDKLGDNRFISYVYEINTAEEAATTQFTKTTEYY
jgi:hypothetical protein